MASADDGYGGGWTGAGIIACAAHVVLCVREDPWVVYGRHGAGLPGSAPARPPDGAGAGLRRGVKARGWCKTRPRSKAAAAGGGAHWGRGPQLAKGAAGAHVARRTAPLLMWPDHPCAVRRWRSALGAGPGASLHSPSPAAAPSAGSSRSASSSGALCVARRSGRASAGTSWSGGSPGVMESLRMIVVTLRPQPLQVSNARDNAAVGVCRCGQWLGEQSAGMQRRACSGTQRCPSSKLSQKADAPKGNK